MKFAAVPACQISECKDGIRHQHIEPVRNILPGIPGNNCSCSSCLQCSLHKSVSVCLLTHKGEKDIPRLYNTVIGLCPGNLHAAFSAVSQKRSSDCLYQFL